MNRKLWLFKSWFAIHLCMNENLSFGDLNQKSQILLIRMKPIFNIFNFRRSSIRSKPCFKKTWNTDCPYSLPWPFLDIQAQEGRKNESPLTQRRSGQFSQIWVQPWGRRYTSSTIQWPSQAAEGGCIPMDPLSDWSMALHKRSQNLQRVKSPE